MKPCIRPEAFNLATIMGEAMQNSGASRAVGRPSSSAASGGTRATTEVKHQILLFQFHIDPKKIYIDIHFFRVSFPRFKILVLF